MNAEIQRGGAEPRSAEWEERSQLQPDGRYHARNATYLGDHGRGERSLPCATVTVDDLPATVSCWTMTWVQRIVALITGRVYLVTRGTMHPPVVVLSRDPIRRA